MLIPELVKIFLLFTIFFGIMFETYSYFFRAFVHKNVAYSTAVSNWVLYFSRLSNVFTMISLAFLLEHSQAISNIFILFFFIHFFSIFYIYFALFKLRFDIFFKIFIFFIEIFFKIKIPYADYKIEKYDINYKLFFFSFMVSVLVYLSLIFPLIAAYNFYEFRMTLTYTSSIFNFFASGLLLSYIEPSFASKANTPLYPKAFYSIFFGKIFAQFALCLVSIFLHFFLF
jgi:hypothetical protein